MSERRLTAPITFFFLVLPYGISGGFVTVTLPFALTRAGFPVAVSASIVAVAISSNLWRFVAGPIADLTLTLRRWHAIGLVASVVTLCLLTLMPLRQDVAGALTIVAFLSQVAATFIVLPVGGLMAHTVAEEQKGRAAGWYQAGNVGGSAFGGGAGVWLVSHYSIQAAGAALALVMLGCGAALYFVPDVRSISGESVRQRLRGMGSDLRDLVRSPVALFTMVLIISAAGAGAAGNLWSAVAKDWHATDDTVALVTGVLAGVVSIVGCVIGGWTADRVGRWWAYLGSATIMALVAAAMALAPRTPTAYGTGVLLYMFSLGLANAAWSAVVLFAIGRGAAATKYALLSSLGNLPVVYMTAFDGWVHDHSGAGAMLNAEAALGLACVGLALLALWRIKAIRPTTLPQSPPR